MKRSATTMLMMVLFPVMGQAAVVQHSAALNTEEEASCRSPQHASGSRARGTIRSNGRLHRLHQVDTGGMLAMGYSYYGAQRPQRTAAARRALGLRVVKGNRRSVSASSHIYRIRHSSVQRAHCVNRTRVRRAMP